MCQCWRVLQVSELNVRTRRHISQDPELSELGVTVTPGVFAMAEAGGSMESTV